MGDLGGDLPGIPAQALNSNLAVDKAPSEPFPPDLPSPWPPAAGAPRRARKCLVAVRLCRTLGAPRDLPHSGPCDTTSRTWFRRRTSGLPRSLGFQGLQPTEHIGGSNDPKHQGASRVTPKYISLPLSSSCYPPANVRVMSCRLITPVHRMILVTIRHCDPGGNCCCRSSTSQVQEEG